MRRFTRIVALLVVALLVAATVRILSIRGLDDRQTWLAALGVVLILIGATVIHAGQREEISS